MIERPFVQKGEKMLIYGIGNLGRQDDGLGIRLVERAGNLPSAARLSELVRFEANYQLGIEDALLLSEFDVVVFVDASRDTSLEGSGEGSGAPYSVTEVQASASIAFTTHAMSISNVISLCDELYQRKPRAFLIAVPGYEWEISEHLSEAAKVNLELAFESVSRLLSEVECTNSH